jgi:type II secretory pathway component PulF
VTSEPAEPLSSDEASLARAGDPTGIPRSAAWDANDEATPAAASWETDDGAAGEGTEASKATSASKAKGAEPDEDLELEAATALRSEPWRLSHMMIAIVVVAVLLWIWVTLKAMALVLLVFGAIVAVITAGFVVARLRTARQDALLAMVTIAVERGLPLAPAIAAFADQFRGRAHRRVMGLAALIHAGAPLPEAMEQTRRIASRDTVLMAWVGHHTGRLARALRLAGESRPARVAAWSAIASRLAYLLLVMLVAEGISAYLLYSIVPRLESIFSDFNARLPQVTVFMIHVSQAAMNYAPIADLIVLAQVALFLYIPFSFGGWVNYRVPVFDRLLARRHAALVLRALSVAIEADKPIALGLRTLSEHYPAPWVRRRLEKVLLDVRLGADWIEALWRTGVIRKADAEVLASAASVGNLAWACRELAETAERRQQLRIQVLTQAIFPLAVILMGLAVAILCLGYFAPLVMLIERLADL